ncbi:uncharacterized protein LOC124462021 [Drosophila willistoni]|uniref:uncharacterized protein LOC124462021 n=1 Tax=Drosophila willistoni TaxID=7260 RepID=UPI001F07A2C1|nr:uncharacterized protein LOC124462021 [Drosophila willistoni]
MLTVQLIMQSGKPLVTNLPISATVYELKAELQSLLNIEPETLEISASDVTCANSDLLIEVAGLGKNKQIKPVVSCYEGNNFVGLILFSLGGEDFADPLVDNSVSDSSIEDSESSVIELSSGSSGGSVQPSTIDCKRGIKRKAQGHEITIETKRIKYVLESSEESLENHSYGDMQEACDMGGCGIKSDHARNVRCLDFNEVTPDTEYNGRLYIAAANEDTMDWVAGNVCSMETYQATSLIDFLHLTPARVTWPKVEKCFQAIFELLEQQNADITTEKWAVPLVTNLPISATVYELKAELQSLLNIEPETLEISASDDFADPLVDNSVSDSSIEDSESSVIELSSGSSGGSVQPSTIDCKRGIKRKAQGHEITIETKRIKYVLESSEESLENHSYGDMQEACDMGGCGIKSRPRPVKHEIEMEPDVINGQRPPYVNILPENRPFVVVISSSECEKNFCDLLEEFFGIFKDFRNVRCLDFNEVTPDTEYNGRLYIAAANEDTMDWWRATYAPWRHIRPPVS